MYSRIRTAPAMWSAVRSPALSALFVCFVEELLRAHVVVPATADDGFDNQRVWNDELKPISFCVIELLVDDLQRLIEVRHRRQRVSEDVSKRRRVIGSATNRE